MFNIIIQALEKQASTVSSTMSLDGPSRASSQRRRGSIAAESIFAMEPLQQFIGEMPKNIMKNDYFVDINPRSMRRLMNIIAMAGELRGDNLLIMHSTYSIRMSQRETV